MRLRTIIIAAAFTLAAASIAAGDQGSGQTIVSKLAWRSVGPFIGGRVVAVAGVPGQNLFYMGAVDGGIWKSTDYGIKWVNISDGTLPGDSNSIGAIAVAPSNPNIIWAGTGESDIRGDMITGDGVFKSTDAGKTWAYAGLRDTHTTSAIAIDPRNAGVAYVASMGHAFAPNADRGVFKTSDGGKTWSKVLFVNDATGAIALSMDLKHPATLYAAMWQAQRQPWKLTSGGAGSGLYKTTDGGAHWTNLSNNPGYPRGVLGRIGVGVSASNPRVVYSIVQAKAGGVFRSDDAGATWRRTNDDMELRQRAFYYMSVYVDPTNPNVIYAPNVQAPWVSRDGGKTFRSLRPPHGDNHVVWIDPRNPKVLLEGNDGGATVSTDGGETWSGEHNQPTGQFYHVSIDDRFPFHIYGAQQDEGSIEGPSASVNGAISSDEWQRVAYGESTFVAPQPGDPTITYGSGYFSIFLQYDATIGQYRSVSPWPDYQEGAYSAELKYRFGWTHPVLFSPANPKELLVGSQYVLRSDDYGRTWQTISPDLTRNDARTEGPTGGPIDLDQTSAEVYPDVSSLAVSPLDNDVIWAGSADGLVHVTTDSGAHWSAVTPPMLPQTAQISSIEPSHVAKGTAYLTASRYMWDDFHPYAYETQDYGAHWTAINAGLPSDQCAFVVRQDPNDANLLFLGTKSSVYLSINGGAEWQPLAINLPKVQVRDLAVDTRQGAVVAATHGRAFWVLDNLALLEAISRGDAGGAPQIFAPQTAWLTHAYGAPPFPSTAAGENPPFGATVFFNIPASYNGKTPVTLTFSDAVGATVRTFALHLKTKPQPTPAAPLFASAARKREADFAATGIRGGANRFQWDLRYPDAADVTGFNPPVAAGGEEDTVSGPVVLPGTYTVTLDYGGSAARASFDVTLDPRIHVAPDALAARFALEQRIHATLDALDRKIDEALALRSRTGPNAALDAAIAGVVQLKINSSEGGLLYETKLHDRLAFLATDVEMAYERPTAAQYAVFDELEAQAKAAQTKLANAIAP
ncbi:MAG TPA: hypothetical protein VKR56_10735 [Candidatus Cybelea sp.]|nr:hypothetical protein [Candidatus Cybelea sp.]